MATSVLVVPIVLYILFVDDADGAVCRSDPISSTISHLFLNIKHITQSVRATCVPFYMFVCCSSDCRAYDRYYHLYHATTRAKYKHTNTSARTARAMQQAKQPKKGETHRVDERHTELSLTSSRRRRGPFTHNISPINYCYYYYNI